MAKWLFAQNCDFVTGAVDVEGLPTSDMTEIAFAGRSNVGKSSLLNALPSRKNLARTSNTPGRTQQINFFNLADKLMIVDLPGYGYAKAPKREVEHWKELINLYIKGRQILKRVYLLIDSRHGLKKADLDFMQVLNEAGVSYQIVLTKSDKVHATEVSKRKHNIELALKEQPAAYPEAIITSAVKKHGMDELRIAIANLLN